MTPFDLKFVTSKGSLYFELSGEKWLRKKHTGEDNRDVIYLGSINPFESEVYGASSKDTSKYRFSTELDQEVLSGDVSGFTPSFEVGNHPLGILYVPEKDSSIERFLRKTLSTVNIMSKERRIPSFDVDSGKIILPGRRFDEIFGRKLDYHLGDMITEVF